MLKSQLVDLIAEQNLHLYRRDLDNVVDAILDRIVAALTRGDRVELRGFGAFSVKNRRARDGRNPRTGAPVAVGQNSVVYAANGSELGVIPAEHNRTPVSAGRPGTPGSAPVGPACSTIGRCAAWPSPLRRAETGK